MDRAGDLLEAFLRLHNITGGEEYVAFFKSWHRIVGTDLAAHTRVTDIKNGALKVEVDHPGWMQILQMKKEEILSRVSAKYPQLEIRTLHMRLVSSFSSPGDRLKSENTLSGSAADAENDTPARPQGQPQREAGDEPPPAETAAASQAEASRTAREALERIEDDELKDTLAQLYRDLRNRNAGRDAA